MAGSEASWRSALTPQKAPTYGNQLMFIVCPKELEILNTDYVVVFEGTKKYHVAIAEVINPYTLHVIIPEHDTAEEVTVKVFVCHNTNQSILAALKFTYVSQMEHAIAKFLAHSASDPEVAEKLDAVWTVCLGKDHVELWDKRLAQAFVQLELPIEWSLVGDILQQDSESQQTLLHFAANHGLKELINVFLDLPGAKRALSTCNKFGLLPRDVARENGRLDLVELLDADRNVEQKKCSSFLKDSSHRRVLRNKDNGVTTITNLRNQNVQEDIQLLRELNKLVKPKNGSPLNRHSWPVKLQSFNAVNYFEDLENELNKASTLGNINKSNQSFLDENLTCLRGVTEELCQLRLLNAEKTSKEISVIADQNRRPMHTRRLSCPASVNRRKKTPQGLPKKVPVRHETRTPESRVEDERQLDEKIPASTEPIFSTPPHSPTVGPLVDIGSSAVITPPQDEPGEQRDDLVDPCDFMTPMDKTPSPPVPTSPLPISYKYSTLDRKSQKKNRPRTWYGGSGDAHPEDETCRRSNSLEDFANKLDDNDDSDDEESISEANSKENVLQATEKDERSASFLSSLSDLSVEKESIGSEIEAINEDGSDEGKECDVEEHEGNEETQENEEVNNENHGNKEVLECETLEEGDIKEPEKDRDEPRYDEDQQNCEEFEQKEDIGENEESDVDEKEENHDLHEHYKQKDPDVVPPCQELDQLIEPENVQDPTEEYREESEIKDCVGCEGNEDVKEVHDVKSNEESSLGEPSASVARQEEQREDDHDNEETLVEENNEKPQVNDNQTEKANDKTSITEDETEVNENRTCATDDQLEETDIQAEVIRDAISVTVEQPEVNEDQTKVNENKSSVASDQTEVNKGQTNVDEDNKEVLREQTIDCRTELSPEIVYAEKECAVSSFCLPSEPGDVKSETSVCYRATRQDDDDEEDEMEQKHIRFNETIEQTEISSDEKSPTCPDNDELNGHEFRQRSALLLGVKAPVKRTGSNVSVTSLQDVQLDMHSTGRNEDITPAVLGASRKARSYGDLSTLRETKTDLTKDDESDEERQRIKEDQQQLLVKNRIKKFDAVSKYASNDKLDQIANSSVISERDDEETGKRRWSNFFNTRPGKKPGRTPTFRRDALRSSMSSLKPGKSGGKKPAIESLVAGQQGVMFARHSATAPNLHVGATRPRSGTKDSPGTVRKSPTVNSLDSDDVKIGPESPEDYLPDDTRPEEPFDLDVDSDLENFDREPEAWSVTVEKKMLKKMSSKEIKRQDVILELVQTEGHHVRTLKIMQQVFYRGLNKIANYSTDRLDQLFPRIDELVDISARFHRNLRCRQDEGASVQKIGDVIVKQFSGESAAIIKDVYGEFVSRHPEAVALYKHYFKTDKKFSSFIKKCHGHRIVRRLSIPECFTLVTQRLTKYPILIEAIIKATKTSSTDYKELQKSLLLVKDAVKAVDNAIKDHEKQSRLKDIKLRMEKGSVVLKSGQKIKNSRFVDYQSKMIYDGILQWKNARGKLTETHVVLLESMVAFLQENDKKFSLLSIDGKSPCIALKTLMVREVATDKNAIYFVSTSKKGPEMYEFVCSNPKEKKQLLSIIADAISKAPEDTGDLFQSPEEEKRLAEERLHRRNELLDMMKNKDQELSALIEEKSKLFMEMKELWYADGNTKVKDEEKVSSVDKVRTILLSAIRRTTQLTTDSMQLHESHSDSELAAIANDERATAPKRAETFGGFDRRPSQKGNRRSTATIAEVTTAEPNHVSQRRDSGFSSTSIGSESVPSALNILNQGQEGGPSTFLQMLEALQWVLVQFSTQETTLEKLRTQFQSAIEEIKKLRTMKTSSDKKQLLMKEEHQAELTRQKKAYSDLERTFKQQVADLKGKLQAQQEQQQELYSNFAELRQAVSKNYPS